MLESTRRCLAYDRVLRGIAQYVVHCQLVRVDVSISNNVRRRRRNSVIVYSKIFHVRIVARVVRVIQSPGHTHVKDVGTVFAVSDHAIFIQDARYARWLMMMAGRGKTEVVENVK